MKHRLVLMATVLALAALVLLLSNSTQATATGTLATRLNKIQKRLVSGFVDYELNASNVTSSVAAGKKLTRKPLSGSPGVSYFPGSDGCSGHFGNNIKINQNCSNLSDSDLQGRSLAQNETAIAADPNHPDHLVAASNDYRRGDGTCGVSYSLNNGATWEDGTMPNGFTRGTAFGDVAREYWQAGGDPAVAWDTKGNAYYDCQEFLRGANGLTPNPDQSSAVYLFRSTLNEGASWNFTGRPVVEYNDTAGSGCCLEDKPYMTVDNHVGSPYQDRIYVTWTEFLGDGTAYMWEAYSSDYGETFSNRVLVSGDNKTLCTNTYGLPTPNGNCNENQFSQPFTGPDGALYVVFANYNNTLVGNDNRNQILIVKSTDGGATFSLPTKVSDYYDLPDCATYQAGQDAYRACVPEKGSATNSVFRAANLPVGGVNPTNANQVVVTVGSYINSKSNESNGCVPEGLSGTTGLNLFDGVKTAGACNNKILLSVSNDGGTTFTGQTTDPRNLPIVNQQKGQARTDQWWQWAVFTRAGKFAVSYYDRQYGNDETTGDMDMSLSASPNMVAFATKRVTSSSMPLPTQFPDAQGNSLFFGDYTGLDAITVAHPIWMDTRNLELFACTSSGPPALCTATEPSGLVANDQDIYTTSTTVP
jgi:hypothetical protein